MSKRPYDFLASEKEPLQYLEASIVCVDDGFLTVKSGKEGVRTLAPSSTLVLMLGAGTSITQEAAIFAATHDMQLAFARGRCNVHSFFMSGRYQNPETLMHQASLVQTQKLDIAKQLLRLRLLRAGEPPETIAQALSQSDLVALTAWEGRWAKLIYKALAVRHKVDFRRDFDGADAVNSKLNVLNNALYSVCTALCLSCGLHPSLGFLHGHTRRGGLAFDLADVYKNELTLPIAFDSSVQGSRDAMYALARGLRKDRMAVVKHMISVCLLLAGQHRELSWESLS